MGSVAIAFSCKDAGSDAGDVAPTLRSMNESDSNMNGGGQVAIAFQLAGDRDNPTVSVSDAAFTLPANPMSDRGQAIAFDTTQITSPDNYSCPEPGDPCHPLASGAHPPAVAFTQNSRDEVRLQSGDGRGAGALSAESGSHQTTYIALQTDVTPKAQEDVAFTLKQPSPSGGGQPQAVAFQPRYARNGRGAPDEVAAALTSEPGSTGKGDSAQCVVFKPSHFTRGKDGAPSDVCPPIMGAGGHSTNAFGDQDPHVLSAVPVADTLSVGANQTSGTKTEFASQGAAVRRLTPRECERLQGIPDDYTLIPFRGRPAADGNRYKALGNSMAVNCMRWLGQRIALVDGIDDEG